MALLFAINLIQTEIQIFFDTFTEFGFDFNYH